METTARLPIDWAKLACDTLMKKFRAEELPPVGRFHYHQGVFLLGMERCWEQTRDPRYLAYVKAWVDSLVDESGHIENYHDQQLDDIMPGILLFLLYDQTGDERYRKALGQLAASFPKLRRNPEGGFWHKDFRPDQMWLDGLFMGGPIAAEYAAKFGRTEFFSMVTLQAKLMAKYCRNEKTGLLYHGWDWSRKAEWADPVKGTAPEFWGRAMGWYTTAILDILDYLPGDHPDRPELERIFGDVIHAVLRVQDPKSGMWYQVLDKGDRPDNWLETSCSCLFAYSLAKAVRKGLLDKKYLENARKGYEGVVSRLTFDDRGGVQIGGVCVGTGIGDYAFYAARPTSINDLHGAGAFIIMCDEMNLA